MRYDLPTPFPSTLVTNKMGYRNKTFSTPSRSMRIISGNLLDRKSASQPKRASSLPKSTFLVSCAGLSLHGYNFRWLLSFRSLRNTEGQVVVEHDPGPGLEESHRHLLIPITRPGSLRFLGCRIPVNIHGLPVSYRSPARIFLVSWAGGAIIASYFGYRLISHPSCFFILSTQHNGASATCRIPKAPGAEIKIARVFQSFRSSKGFQSARCLGSPFSFLLSLT